MIDKDFDSLLITIIPNRPEKVNLYTLFHAFSIALFVL